MLNPDRAEFGSQPISVLGTPRRNGHLPRWARVPTFAFRASLAILTATPSAVVVADMINHKENSSIVYDLGQKPTTVNLLVGLDQPQLATPTPTETAHSPTTYNVKLCMSVSDRSCTGSFSHLTQCFASEQNRNPKIPLCTGSDKEYLLIGPNYGSNTGITLKAGQNLEISATGRVRILSPESALSIFRDKGCHNWDEVDSDGNRYLPPLDVQGREHTFRWNEVYPNGNRSLRDSDTICSPTNDTHGEDGYWNGRHYEDAPRGSLIGRIGDGFNVRPGSIDNAKGMFSVGSQWQGSADHDGMLNLGINFKGGEYSSYGEKRGFDITVKVYPLSASAPLSGSTVIPESMQGVVTTPIPSRASEVTPSSISTDKNPDLSSWLLGLGTAFFAGLVSYKLFEKWRFGKGVGAQASTATTARIGTIAGVLQAPSNSNTVPNFGLVNRKNPEWVIGQQEFEEKWQNAKGKFSATRVGDTGNEPEYILERFKTAMGIVHEVSLNSRVRVPLMAIRARAGMEHLIPQVWPNDRILKRFFDPNFNAGYLTEEVLAKIIYLPENYRNLSTFSDDQRRDIRRIRRVLMFALHPDTAKADSDKNLQVSVDDLLKVFNPAWSYIEKLIK